MDLTYFDDIYSLGRLLYERGDFLMAIDKFQKASEGYFKLHSFDKYLDCQNKLLRSYAETENHEMINQTKETFQDLVLQEGFQLNAKTYYTLGLSASFKNQNQVALDYLQKSLEIALTENCKFDICYAINGIAIIYLIKNQFAEALKEIYNLEVFFQVLDLPEVEMSTQFCKGHIQRRLKKYDQALEIFWKCYERLKDLKNFYYYIYVLYSLGITYDEKGDRETGRMYLNLAKRVVDPKNMSLMAKQIEKRLSYKCSPEYAGYDLVLEATSHAIVEKNLGRVHFKNQFILLDLLRLFLSHPGSVYSKEKLVQVIWKQQYDPAVHDNKIYVTIKRLRKLIEPDYNKPKYIFRAKNGYYLSKSANILVN